MAGPIGNSEYAVTIQTRMQLAETIIKGQQQKAQCSFLPSQISLAGNWCLQRDEKTCMGYRLFHVNSKTFDEAGALQERDKAKHQYKVIVLAGTLSLYVIVQGLSIALWKYR